VPYRRVGNQFHKGVDYQDKGNDDPEEQRKTIVGARYAIGESVIRDGAVIADNTHSALIAAIVLL